jgi:hypothetical protein
MPNGILDGPVIASDGIHETDVTDDSYRVGTIPLLLQTN